MKILIIEDEKRNAARLERLLHEIDATLQVEGPLESITQTVAYLEASDVPDLILADIRLTDGLSFDALRKSSTSAAVIFTTAYDEYAIQAFKFNSFDYLLKPIDIDELKIAIDKVKERMAKQTQIDSIQFQALLQAMQSHQYKYRERFLIPWRDGYRTVMVSDINHITLVDRSSMLFLNDGTSMSVHYSMDDLEKELNPDEFFRANRQYIINVNHILSVQNYFTGRLILRLKGYSDDEVIISRERAYQFKVWIDK